MDIVPEQGGNILEDDEVCTIAHLHLEYFERSFPFLNVTPPLSVGTSQKNIEYKGFSPNCFQKYGTKVLIIGKTEK